MLPSEFIARYGQTVSSIVRVPAFGKKIVPANPDRYVLAFVLASSGVCITPNGDDFAVFAASFGASTTIPFILTHALHGAMVNQAWLLQPVIGAVEVIVVEGFMQGSSTPKVVPHAKVNGRTVQERRGNGSARASVTAKSPSRLSDRYQRPSDGDSGH